ncbi:MAG: NAD-dependent deacylase [Flavobacteriales bacterium]|nr:NAD-dependent deacylase [Flavobacteriales bacterium]
MKKLVVLSGAGMSAESGINTFRDTGGLWEGHNVNEVATPEAWKRNMKLVLDFYNQRRYDVIRAKPNLAHIELYDLEKYFKVEIITQNVDDLHERAGSGNVLHLHGEIRKSRSTGHPENIYPIKGDELNVGDLCEKGFQLRPHIVWFGEMVVEMENAIKRISDADIVLIIGTSMSVYPANGLMNYAPDHSVIYYIDPKVPDYKFYRDVHHIQQKAVYGISVFKENVMKLS